MRGHRRPREGENAAAYRALPWRQVRRLAEILLEAEEGVLRIPRKAASLVKPLVNMEGIEDVVFDEEDGASPDGKDGQEESTQASE